MNETSNKNTVDPAQELQRLRRIYAENNGRIVELERQVAHLEGVLAAVDRENELNRERLKEMRNSLSWRLTGGLRRARRFASRAARAEL